MRNPDIGGSLRRRLRWSHSRPGARRLLRTSVVLTVMATGMQACGDERAASSPTDPPGPTGTFTLTAAPTTVSILKGGTGEARLAVVRSGFTGNVSFAVTGATAGMVARIDPNNTTGTTANLVVSADSAVATGVATLRITATAPGWTPQTASVDISITPPHSNTGNVTVDFSKCGSGPDDRPIWFAFQDGSGPWTQILGVADVFRFDVASAKGGYAFVTRRQTYSTVEFATQAELTRAPIERCRSQTNTKTLSGKVVGLIPGDVVYLGMGGLPQEPEGGPIPTSFVLGGLEPGPLDLIAYRSTPPIFVTSERVIIRRDQNIPNGSALNDIDFNGEEAFVPATARLTITGGGSEPVHHYMGYRSGVSCLAYQFYDHRQSGPNSTMRGIPPAQQRATDFHHVGVYVSGDFAFREASEFFHSLTDRVVALPAALPPPAITAPASAHKRIQAALTLPAEYQSGPVLLLMYAYEGQGSAQKGWFTFVTASSAWLGSPNITLAVPDFSGVSGWRSSFLPAAGHAGGWIVVAQATNSAAAGGSCAENARSVYAQVGGKH